MRVRSIKELIRSRRGIAIEYAVGALLLVVAFSIMLTSVATHEIAKLRSVGDDLAAEIAITEVGDYAVANWPDAPGDTVGTVNGVEYTITYGGENNNTATVKKSGDEVVLTITKDGDKITSWEE